MYKEFMMQRGWRKVLAAEHGIAGVHGSEGPCMQKVTSFWTTLHDTRGFEEILEQIEAAAPCLEGNTS